MRQLIRKLKTELLSARFKNNKLLYYLSNYIRCYIPGWVYRIQLERKLQSLSWCNYENVWERVNYYNKYECGFYPLVSAVRLDTLKPRRKQKTYLFDLRFYTRFFPGHKTVDYVFGDITHVPLVPSIVKSRPINGNNGKSVLLKLNKVRHFTFVKDQKPFSKKKDQLVWRGNIRPTQVQRIDFVNKFAGHPRCNVGHVNSDVYLSTPVVEKLNMLEQLDYKFIMCLEGHDVATNLKWVMSSNSLAVMPRPKYETWFMEGMLVPGYHYVLVKDDYSDLEEKIDYYLDHPEEAIAIINHAHEHVAQFTDTRQEELIGLMVLNKYFSRQMVAPTYRLRDASTYSVRPLDVEAMSIC